MVAARLARLRSGTPQPPRTTARLPCDSSRRREARERGQPPGRVPAKLGPGQFLFYPRPLDRYRNVAGVLPGLYVRRVGSVP
jgi:hypothetical protein